MGRPKKKPLPEPQPIAKLEDHPLRVRDRVTDLHGRTGTIVGASNGKLLVAFVVVEALGRSQFYHSPNTDEIMSAAERVRENWDAREEQAHNNYPTEAVETQVVGTAKLFAKPLKIGGD
jgi:hypothetical protein